MGDNQRRGRLARTAVVLLASLLALPFQVTPAAAAPGEPDTGFGGGGVSLDFSDPRDDVINDVEATYYGDVWFAGSSGDDVLVGGRFAVDGYPAQFGGLDGMTTIDFGAPAEALAIDLNAFGGLVVAGRAGNDFAAAVIDSAGNPGSAPASGFDARGRRVVPFAQGPSVAYGVGAGAAVGGVQSSTDEDSVVVGLGVGSSAYSNSTLMAPTVVDLAPGADDHLTSSFALDSGSIYVAGTAGGNAVLAKLHRHDGALDTTFASGGVFTLPSRTDRATTMSYLESGHLLVAGEAGSDGFVAAMSTSGALVSSFGTNGVAYVDLGVETSIQAIRPEGNKVLLLGTRVASGSTASAFAARILSTGALDGAYPTIDETFGGTSAFGAGGFVDRDGRLVLAGTALGAPGADGLLVGGLVRRTANQVLDPAFDGDGRIIVREFVAAADVGGGSVAQPDGKIVTVGGSDGRLTMARLLANGALDPSFGDGGAVVDDLGTEAGAHVFLGPGGRIVVATSGFDGTSSFGRLRRYLADGTPDGTFAPDARWSGVLQGVAQLPDGRFVVLTRGGNGGMAVSRLSVDGVFDPSFGAGGYASMGIVQSPAVLAVLPDGDLFATGRDGWSWDSPTAYRFDANGNHRYSGTLPFIGEPFSAVGLADGRIAVGGQYGTSGTLTVLMPYLARDTSFGGGDGRIELEGPPMGCVAQGSRLMITESGRPFPVYRLLLGTGAIDPTFADSLFESSGTFPHLVAAGANRALLTFSTFDGVDADHAVVLLDTSIPTPPPPPPPPPSQPAPPAPPQPAGPAARSGYWMAGADGAVYAFGDAGWLGNAPTSATEDLEPTPSRDGYWIVNGAGHVFGFGDAGYFGGINGALRAGERVTSISATKSGQGYWLFTTQGRVAAFGDAPHLGDMAATRLNGPVLDSIPTPSGRGYYMVASDGGIFTFGDAAFHGSMGDQRLNAPVQSLVPDGDGVGYWLVASDGGIFTFDAAFYGSMGSVNLNRPITGMVAFGSAGYLMVAEDGGIFTFGSASFHGSLGASPPARPITTVAALG